MKTLEFLSRYRDMKQNIKEYARKMMLTKLVADNLRDVIPDSYEISAVSYGYGIKICPKDETLSIDNFPKMTKKITRLLRKKPSVDINKYFIAATWWVYPSFANHEYYRNQVRIELVFGNKEQCEITYRKVEVDEIELTGYCKTIKEMTYDIN